MYSVVRWRLILITVSHERPIGCLLSRNRPWLGGEFSRDDVFGSSVVEMSRSGLWVAGVLFICFCDVDLLLSEMCRNHRGPPWLPELHAVQGYCGV